WRKWGPECAVASSGTKQGPGADTDSSCGAEEARMARHASESRGIVVVHFADEDATAADVLVHRDGWRDRSGLALRHAERQPFVLQIWNDRVELRVERPMSALFQGEA